MKNEKKQEIHTVQSVVWRETLNNVHNEENTLQELEFGKKQ